MHDNWITKIYNLYDAMFSFWENQDEKAWLKKIIIENGLKDKLWDENGEYKWQAKPAYEGYEFAKTSEGEREAKKSGLAKFPTDEWLR